MRPLTPWRAFTRLARQKTIHAGYPTRQLFAAGVTIILSTHNIQLFYQTAQNERMNAQLEEENEELREALQSGGESPIIRKLRGEVEEARKDVRELLWWIELRSGLMDEDMRRAGEETSEVKGDLMRLLDWVEEQRRKGIWRGEGVETGD